MKHLIIIGARGFGREVLGTARKSREVLSGEWTIKGFLDDKADALAGLDNALDTSTSTPIYPPILGPVESYQPEQDDIFFCALGDAHYRRKYAQIILDKGGTFVSLISSRAIIYPTAKIGVGCFIGSMTTVSDHAEIGPFTMIHSFCTFGHDVKIGAYNSVEAYCFFGGYSSTGEETTMHVRSAIIRHKHIGSRVSVGFGSVVMRNFGDDVHLFGNPAKRLIF